MAFPPAHILVGISGAELVRGFAPLPRWRAWLLGGILAVLPDADFAIGLARGAPTLYHGTFTHSLFAVAAVGILVGMAAGRRWGVLAAVCYATHLLVDLLDVRGQTNVMLGWPFTEQPAMGIAALFPLVHFVQGEGVLNAFLSLFRPSTLQQLAVQTAIGGLVAAPLFALGRFARRLRGSRPERRAGRAPMESAPRE